MAFMVCWSVNTNRMFGLSGPELFLIFAEPQEERIKTVMTGINKLMKLRNTCMILGLNC